ncbi:hypothetical protein [Nocardiopsis gilva]|nr:hypothetical protein [Nocardiopsis gilva]
MDRRGAHADVHIEAGSGGVWDLVTDIELPMATWRYTLTRRTEVPG